jgi:HSP20 family protein
MTTNGKYPLKQDVTDSVDGVRSGVSGTSVMPAADIYETPDSYVLSLDMPGARKERISLTLDRGMLEVSAEVEPRHEESATLLRREILTEGYRRSFTLGEGIDRESVDARFEDGVLTVKLFKSPEAKPREIRIH